MNPSRIEGLYAIADADCRPEMTMEQKVRALLEGGASVLQIRMKSAPARALFDASRRAVELAAGWGAPVIVNDRPDVALASGAAGVHVGDEDLPVAEIRRFAPPGFIVGVTVRTLEQARRAAGEGADYVGFGPVYATGTKKVDAAPRGLAMLAEVSAGAGIPVVAIAGITLERAGEVARAGAAAAAVVSELLAAPDIAARTRAFVEAFRTGRETR